MITKTIDGIGFKLREDCDFSFLSEYGKVFCVFDQNDSGNISFGVSNNKEKFFIKVAGARTQESSRQPQEAVEMLKKAMPTYEAIKHPNLIELIKHYELDSLYIAVFRWTEGECLFDHWNFEKYANTPGLKSPFSKYKKLSIQERLESVAKIFDFLTYVHTKGYVAVDFYDGSILYDFRNHNTYICDIDLFRMKPTCNNMGEEFWGTKRLKAPEEYTYGARIDELTNVFTLGALLFNFFASYSNEEINKMYKNNKFTPCLLENWELDHKLYKVLLKAVEVDRRKRYQSIRVMWDTWNKALSELNF